MTTSGEDEADSLTIASWIRNDCLLGDGAREYSRKMLSNAVRQNRSGIFVGRVPSGGGPLGSLGCRGGGSF